MYLEFYGLRELPFELTPNPRFLFLTPQHREALSNLQYGLTSSKALTVLTGEAGTGKTSVLAACLHADACQHVRPVLLNNPTLTREEFVQSLASKFGFPPDAGRSKATLLDMLEQALIDSRSEGYITALIVDEAHCLSDELFEEVRLLANIETADEKLLPIVLVGQPELSQRLNQPNLRQLKQRVSLRCNIVPLSVTESAAFIAWRIRTAGGDPSRLFSRDAVIRIHELSHGIPRLINLLCDNSLVNGMALQRRPINRDLIDEVSRDFDLEATPIAVPDTPPSPGPAGPAELAATYASESSSAPPVIPQAPVAAPATAAEPLRDVPPRRQPGPR